MDTLYILTCHTYNIYNTCNTIYIYTYTVTHAIQYIHICKSCCAEANVKTEIRKKGSAGSMEAWSYAQYAGETEREKHTKKLYFE